MNRIGLGLIGTGFMGRAHALAFHNARAAFDLPLQVQPVAVADADPAKARDCALAWGFEGAAESWQALVADPRIQLVAITTPNRLHHPMALAALAAGKAVYCEKPLAVGLAEATEMRDAARAAGVVTRVGYNYQQNPTLLLARELLASGELGEITSFTGDFSEDFMADPAGAFTWRCLADQGGGALGDLGSHLLALARFLLGDVAAVCADLHRMHLQRPLPDGGSRAVEVDDQANVLVRFANGARGTLGTSWLRQGRKNRLAFEVNGTRGTLCYDQERLNELRLLRARPGALHGFETLMAGPHLPGYAAFCPAPGHQLGYNELKTLEVRALIEALAGRPAPGVDFEEAWHIERLADACRVSSHEQRWIAL